MLPRVEVNPLRAIAKRIGIGVGVLLLLALLVWLDRDGYSDLDEEVTFIDAVYYATVSASTTGFGDITPVTAQARLVNVLVITPLRVAFLVVLVGSTLEVATRASRQRRRLERWARRIHDHTVVIGFGTMGRGAASRLLGSGVPAERIVVVDPDPDAVAEATARGLAAVLADGTREDALQAAAVDTACCVVVAVPTDATAVLASLTAQRLNPSARIVGAVGQAENAGLLHASGADAVMVTADAAGRHLALSLGSHAAGEIYAELLTPGAGADLVERSVRADEVGRAPESLDDLVVAVFRDGHVQPAPSVLAEGDVLVTVVHRGGR